MKERLPEKEYQEVFNLFRMGLFDSVLKWFSDKSLSPKDQLFLLESILHKVGQQWSEGSISLTQIYIISKITEKLSTKLIEEEFSDKTGHIIKGRIVLGTMEEDSHSLGKNIIKRFLQPFFDVFDLGIDVPVDKFITKAQEVRVDIIAVSALMMTSVTKIPQLRKEIDRQKWPEDRKPKLLVGGAPFAVDSKLGRRVKADAYATNAFEVVEKCLKLLED